jgi:hypothetical protein
MVCPLQDQPYQAPPTVATTDPKAAPVTVPSTPNVEASTAAVSAAREPSSQTDPIVDERQMVPEIAVLVRLDVTYLHAAVEVGDYAARG